MKDFLSHAAWRAPRLLPAMFCALVVSGLAGAARGQQVEAIAGTPFGVGRITLTLSGSEAAAVSATDALVLEDQEGRALYPAFAARQSGRLLAELTGAGQLSSRVVTAWFLFRGERPLELTLYAPTARRLRVAPREADEPREHTELLDEWWRAYLASARRQEQQGDYPPLPQAYLTTMLARRLQLDTPLLGQPREPGEARETFELLLGLEDYRLEMLKRTNLTPVLTSEGASLPVPDDIAWPALTPAFAPEVQVEEIARYVPAECFYVRFGTFANYIWFRKLLEENGGELGRLVALRGFDANLGGRLERQIALKQSALSEVFGGQVIKDVAFLGRDFYMREGAAFGILFQTFPGAAPVLANDFRAQHREAQRREAERGAVIEQVEIAGRRVSLLSTPDNRLRSFYAADGDFHLVTTSRAMVERFFAAGQGERSLGQSAEFKHARSILPLERDDTVFLYFSPAFFQGLLSPQYQVELARRMRAVTDIELVLLGRLAARAEGKPGGTIDDLVAGGFLPAGFGRRSDGSETVLRQGRVLDSRRGARGSFLPIPDVPLEGVTSAEQTDYERRASYYEQSWQQLDPLMVGIKRFALNEDRLERIVVDARVSPLHEEKYRWLTSLLGPPIEQRMSVPAGSIVSAQMSVRGGLLFPHIPPHILFVGVQDMVPASDLKPEGFFEILRLLQTTPGYLGAWPKPGFLDMLPLGLGGGPPDTLGYSRLLLGLWRRQWDAFSTLSFDYRVLSDVTPQLRVEPSEGEAQVFIDVGDLSTAEFSTWVTAMNYARARQATLGNLNFLHAMSQQFRIARQDVLGATEDLIDARLICSLGGEYRIVESPDRPAQWTSNRLTLDGAQQVPEDYEAPLLRWFRGLSLELSKAEEQLLVHAELDMQRAADEPKADLPLFNLFQGLPKKKREAAPDGGSKPSETGERSVPREF